MLGRLLQLASHAAPLQLLERSISVTAGICKSVNKRLLDFSKVPSVDEKDLRVQYVRGSGPGGQATNKTSNCVVMKHVPTGIVVKCHETRSQEQNKKLALERMVNMLDKHFNGEDSIEKQTERILRKKMMEKKRRQKKRAAEKERAAAEKMAKEEEDVIVVEEEKIVEKDSNDCK